MNPYPNEKDRARLERDWTAWWAGELERPLVMMYGIEPPTSGALPYAPQFASNLPLDLPADQAIERYDAQLRTMRFYGDAFPRWWPNFGPGIVAGFTGARVHSTEETVWFSPAEEEMPIADLHVRYDETNVWWQRVQALTRAAVERWGRRVIVGLTDLGGNLDILASFRTSQQLLLDLYDAPDEVARLTREITRAWLRYYDELAAIVQPVCGTSPWAPLWSPGRCYILQSDFSYMISPKMFERFVLPDLAECCAHLDHPFYHLDGKGQLPHLDLLLALKELRGIQWVPGDGVPPPEEWLPVLQRIREAGKLCQLTVTPAGALKIVHALGGKGFAFLIQNPLRATDAADLFKAILE